METKQSSDLLANLIEIQSHQTKIQTYTHLILEQEKRFSFVSQNVLKRTKEIEHLKTDIVFIKKSISNHEANLEKNQALLAKKKEQEKIVTTNQQIQSIEKEIALLNKNGATLEKDLFALLEQEESISIQIEESNQFIAQAKISIKQIEDEIAQIKNKNSLKISAEQKRIDFIIDSIGEIFDLNHKDDVQTTLLKFKQNTFIAFLNKFICQKCYFTIPSAIEEKVSRAFFLYHCPSCERFLLPQI